MTKQKPINPAHTLILDSINPAENENILILEGGDGWLAEQIAHLVPKGKILFLDRDIRNIRCSLEILDRLPNVRVAESVFPNRKGWDTVLMTIPKERRFARFLIMKSWETLKAGGQIYLAGPTRQGAKAVIKDAQRLFGNAVVVGYRSHQRLARCVKNEDIFPHPLPKEFQKPGIAPGTNHKIWLQQPEANLVLETNPGIFSWQKVDEGTMLLLGNLVIDPGSSVWDIGCGYGVIGLWAAIKGAEFVFMSDVNLLAVDYAFRNAVQNQLESIVATSPGDGLEVTHKEIQPSRFDLIVSNPAFHQGRKVDKSMAGTVIANSSRYLKPGGRLILVANQFLNYDQYLDNYFNQVSKLAQTNKYHVIQGIK
jgi:16S rRNA (guanine1207-N2)-methyltransferase